MFSPLTTFLSALLLLNGAMAQGDSSNGVSTTTYFNHVQSTAVALVTMTGTPPPTTSESSISSESSTSSSSISLPTTLSSSSISLPTTLTTASNTTTAIASTTAVPSQGNGNSTSGNSTNSAPGSPSLAPHGGAASAISVSSGLMAAVIGFLVMLN